MLKRKFGDRSDWKRVLVREYAQSFINSEYFNGYVTLIRTVKVSAPLYAEYNGVKICVVDDGYLWLQQFPSDHNHSVTTMFDSKGNIVQWYIDICLQNGVSENNVPWMEDLFLDVIVLPSGEIFNKDINELEEAFLNGTINKKMYDLAREESAILNDLIKRNEFTLIKLSKEHKELLLQMI
ncbi:DUF402 domain-containing protein [Paenibacillus sp. CGMCC 1.16610]|uniref:DUF402 domain-containing protein n=1 Tax=Paenibacillus anseongense TaxID=2682845 RepID=A0ABW9UGS4_9BACL|nr:MULTISPECIES: DUF402 domain-containing protein [Paenibacillus]MBA2939727.1 DUF402 domain-containing protein [Paenibacillus sp. CGMCC 1.16610]MVQ39387.1 DUF402 domain-containing protein [Paenibacillus anseongense]